MKEQRIKPEDEFEKAIREIEEKIVTVVKNNPGISTKEVYEREKARLRRYTGMTADGIRQAFTTALGRRLGEEIQCLGRAKKIEGKYYQQLTLFEA